MCRQARDGQFLRFAADGAASLKAYPEGPSGNCLLQVVGGGSGGMIKLKTNHGTFLSLTRDSSVKAVATGRTGFRVMSAGGKFVFTHESGKVIDVCGGKLCAVDSPTPNAEFQAVPGNSSADFQAVSDKSDAVSASSSSKSQPKTPVSKWVFLKPSDVAAAAAAALRDQESKTLADVSEAAVDLKGAIVPQALHFSQVSTSKTPESATKHSRTSVSKRTAAAAAGPPEPSVAAKVTEPPNAELPLAFSLYVSHSTNLLAL